MKKTTTYSPEARECAARMVLEHLNDYRFGVGGNRGHSPQDWLPRTNPAWLDTPTSDQHGTAARSNQ